MICPTSNLLILYVFVGFARCMGSVVYPHSVITATRSDSPVLSQNAVPCPAREPVDTYRGDVLPVDGAPTAPGVRGRLVTKQATTKGPPVDLGVTLAVSHRHSVLDGRKRRDAQPRIEYRTHQKLLSSAGADRARLVAGLADNCPELSSSRE